MTPATPARVPATHTAIVAALLAFAADLVAAQFTAEPARLVARQRIRRDRIDAVGTASIAQNGRLLAFVGRDSSSRGYCCQHVYVLDRSTGEITQESISADGTPSQGDSQAPSLSADGRMVARKEAYDLAGRLIAYMIDSEFDTDESRQRLWEVWNRARGKDPYKDLDDLEEHERPEELPKPLTSSAQ